MTARARLAAGWLAAGWLAAVPVVLGGPGHAQSPAVAGAPAKAAEPLPQPALPFQMRPVEAFRGIVDKPLFSPYRKPPPESAATGDTAAATALSKNNFDLTGVMIAGDIAVAVLRDRVTTKYQSGHVGDVIGGWTVSEITENSVVLTQGAASERLEQVRKATWPAIGATPGAAPKQTPPPAAAPPPQPVAQAIAPVPPPPPPTNPGPGRPIR